MNKSLCVEHYHCKRKIFLLLVTVRNTLSVSNDGGHCLKGKVTTCSATHLGAQSRFVSSSLIEITGRGLLELRNFLLEKGVFRWFLFYIDLGNSNMQAAWIY